MTEEWFQTYDEQGNALQLVSRAQVHATGLWHRAANVLLFRSNGHLLLQRRAAGKDVCPGLWDLSVAEHLQPGESFLEGAIRGLAEELGIEGVTLSPRGEILQIRLEFPGIRDCEFQQTFYGVSDSPARPDPAEVAEVTTITPTDLNQQLMRNPELFTPWFRRLLEQHPLPG